MLKNSYLPLLLLIATTVQGNQPHPFFQELEEELLEFQKQMVEQIKSVRQHSSWTGSYPLTSVSIAEDKKGVVVTLTNVDAQSLSANLNDANNQLSIEAGNTTITIQARNTLVSVTTTQEIKQTKEENESTSKQTFYSSSSSQSAKNVTRPVDLEKQTIEYDADKKTLTILFEYKPEKKGKSVPITVVNKKEETAA